MRVKLSVFAVFVYIQAGVAQLTCLKGDCVNGYGEAVFPSGSRYIGTFVNRKPHGNGTMFFPEGHRYTGNWKNQYREGKGTFTFADGDVYEGEFIRNAFEGLGIMTFKSGGIYDGNWLASTPHGYGVLLSKGGNRYAGNFVKGKFDGIGIMWYADGSRYDGTWKAGFRNGIGTFTATDGHQNQGYWNNDTFLGASPELPIIQYTGIDSSTEASSKTSSPFNSNPLAADNSVRVWAVLVGVAQYNQLQVLRYTDDDAYKLSGFLRSPEGGAVPESQMAVLIDEDAKRDAIIQALVRAANQADENDVLIFYFSGHGIEGAFLPVDFDGVHNKLPHAEIRDILNISRAKSKIVLADACHSGSLFTAKTPVSQVLEKYYAAFALSKGGLALLLSSRSNEYSLEDNKLRAGVFSYYLMKGVRGIADSNMNGVITVQELFTYLHANVRSYTLNAQTPLLLGNFDPQMPFAVIR